MACLASESVPISLAAQLHLPNSFQPVTQILILISRIDGALSLSKADDVTVARSRERVAVTSSVYSG